LRRINGTSCSNTQHSKPLCKMTLFPPDRSPRPRLSTTQCRKIASRCEHFFGGTSVRPLIFPRWLSPDPYNGSYNLADPQSLNRYAYLAGRPLAAVDSLGLDGGFWSSILEFISAGRYDPDDSKGTKGSSPSEDGYGVVNPGHPYIFSEYVSGYGGGGSNFNTALLGVAAYFVPTGGAQGARFTNAQIIRASLKQPQLRACSQSLFGSSSALTSSNAPGISVISPSEMKDLTGKADSGGTYNSASRTVLFNSEIYYSQTLPFIYFQSNYLHEAGNLLSIEKYASPTAVGGRYGYKYPDDPDSGASYERCIFGQRMQIP
jgi:hypothetical protein